MENTAKFAYAHRDPDMTDAKFRVGQEVVVQPTRQSAALRGTVVSSNWNESFHEWAYYIRLDSGHGWGTYNTAWEREMRAA
jgi:hypothetical protein